MVMMMNFSVILTVITSEFVIFVHSGE